MRSTTNVLILNLAFADLLFIVFCVPFTATDYALNHWPFGPPLGQLACQAVQYLIYVTSSVSIYTLILMSVDRFLAVVFPVHSLEYRNVRNATIAIVITWTAIGTVSTPIWLAHHLRAIPGNPSNSSDSGNVRSHTSDYWCRYDSKNHSETLFHIAFFVSSYAVPLLVIVILYIIMLRRLWRPSPAMTITKSTRRPGAMAAVAATVGVAAQTANASAAVKAAANKSKVAKESQRNKRRVTRLVLVVIVVFCVSWAPIQFVLLLRAIGVYPFSEPSIIFQIFSQVLAYINSCVNPILYAFLSENFRKAFKQRVPGILLLLFGHRQALNGGPINGRFNGGKSFRAGGTAPNVRRELVHIPPDHQPMVGNQSTTNPNAKAESNGVHHRTRSPKLGVITNGSLLTAAAGAAVAGNPVQNGTTARANRRVSFFAENSHTQISSQTQQSPLTADEHTTAPTPTKLFFGEKANTQEPLAMPSLNDQIKGTSVDNQLNNQEASATIGVYAFSEPSEIIRMVRPKKSSISYSLLTKETNRPPSSSSSTCQCYYTSLPDMRNFSGKNCQNGRPLLAKRPMSNRLSDEDDQDTGSEQFSEAENCCCCCCCEEEEEENANVSSDESSDGAELNICLRVSPAEAKADLGSESETYSKASPNEGHKVPESPKPRNGLLVNKFPHSRKPQTESIVSHSQIASTLV